MYFGFYYIWDETENIFPKTGKILNYLRGTYDVFSVCLGLLKSSGQDANLKDAVGVVLSAAVGTYLDGGSYVDAAKAASISFLANTFGGKVGTNIQRRIGQGIDAPAKILHEVASSLSAAQKVLLAQILSSALNITVEEAERILNEVLNGC
ncbi:MAG: hypothetical protein COB09_14895 [Thalassobium sp.]|nr:MAG: hypothetical protein COB09_14895 [Thalassobium sp.]